MVYLNGLIIVLYVLAATAGVWHALLYKRDSRAAFGWIAVCVFFPLAGPLLYYTLGVNRVESRARFLGGVQNRRRFIDFERGVGPSVIDERNDATLPESNATSGLRRAVQAITGQPLLAGHQLEILHNGEGTYPAMLAAIEQAQDSIVLMTYIFETNATGRRFIDLLGDAVARGVEVRVVIDGMGEKYSFPRASRLLKRVGVQVRRFNPPKLVPPSLPLNLRNHRKIMVVDQRVSFTGGINIGDRHLVDDPTAKKAVADIHFRITGPIVAQFSAVFDESWLQAGGKPRSVAKQGASGKVTPASNQLGDDAGLNAGVGCFCRVITDGPDEDLDRLALVLEAAVSSAKQSIKIMTPYFLPNRALISALRGAALRGVSVQIVLPEKSNLPYVHWATRNMLWELLYYHAEVFYQPPPFAHSKLFLVDDDYALIGSANIDPRSLRLNYELGVEIYDDDTTQTLTRHFKKMVDISRPVSLEEVDGRSLLHRTRDSLCWLFSPYL